MFALFAPCPVSGAGDTARRDPAGATVGLREAEHGAVSRQALRHHHHPRSSARQAGHGGGEEEGLQPRAVPAGGGQGHQDRGHAPGEHELQDIRYLFTCFFIW